MVGLWGRLVILFFVGLQLERGRDYVTVFVSVSSRLPLGGGCVPRGGVFHYILGSAISFLFGGIKR